MSLFSRFSYYIDALYKIQASLCQCLFDQSKQQTYVKLLANLISFSFLIRKIIEFFLLLFIFPLHFPISLIEPIELSIKYLPFMSEIFFEYLIVMVARRTRDY